MRRRYILLLLLGVIAGLTFSAIAQERSSSTSATKVSSPSNSSTLSGPAASHGSRTVSDGAAEERVLRLEGEKRFRTNCGRCHMAPHKFPARVMATAIRHMRVRALITDDDMRLILHYMTQ
jgi:hypothetical protein